MFSPPDPFEEVRKALTEGHLIICVGPLLSAWAKLASVDDVTRSLIKVAAKLDGDLDVQRLEKLVANGEASQALDDLKARLGDVSFTRHVRDGLDDSTRVIPRVAKQIAALRKQNLRAVYTTNLDRVIEQAFGHVWPKFWRPQSTLVQRQGIVFKLRGDLQEEDRWVLTKTQELSEFGSVYSRRRLLFDRAYGAHHMLFVGFNLHCRLLSKLLDMPAPSESDEAKPSHFIVFEGEVSLPDRQQLERRGLTVFDGGAEQFIDRLADPEGELERRVDGREPEPMHTDARPTHVRERCPYPGLEPFSYDMRGFFFGRHAEASEASAMLGHVEPKQPANRWLAIEGSSGVGKSSFVNAGIRKALERGFAPGTPTRWRVASMRPGCRPLRALAKAILGLHGTAEVTEDQVAALEHGMRVSPRALVDELDRLPKANEAVLLIIDQLEETVSISLDEDRGPFSAAIAAALDAERIYLVTTMRSDFVPKLAIGVPGLSELFGHQAQRYLLPPISLLGLRDAIVQPALRVKVKIEPALVERILNDADGRTMQERQSLASTTGVSTLSLAAHVLRTLWDAGAADDEHIELDEYLTAGGLEGTLSSSADAVLGKLSEGQEQEQARALLLALVVPSWRGYPARKTLTLADAVAIAGGDERGRHIVDVLSGAGGSKGAFRILSVHDGSVDIVHEALFSGWKQYSEWIVSNWSSILIEDKVRRGAMQWQATGCRPVGLSSDIRVETWLAVTPHGENADLVRRFQDALRAAAARNHARDEAPRKQAQLLLIREHEQRLRRTGVAATVAGLLAGLLVGWLIPGEPPIVADCPEPVSDRSRELGLRASLLASMPGRELEALELAVQAVGEVGPDTQPPTPEAVQGLVDALTHTRMLRTLRGHEGALRRVVFSPDGSSLVTAGEDGVVRLWKPPFDAPITVGDHGTSVTSAVFSRDGTMLATASRDGNVELWSMNDRESPSLPLRHMNPVTSLVFSPDATMIVSAAERDPEAQLAFIGDGGHAIALSPREPDAEAVTALACSPDGSNVIVTGDGRGQLRAWRAEPGGHPAIVPVFSREAHDAPIAAIAYATDGSRLASASVSGEVRVWSPAGDPSPSPNRLLTRSALVELTWSSTTLLAAAGRDGVVHTWDLGSNEHAWFEAHRAPITGLVFSSDGSMLATSSEDHGARLWDARRGRLLARFEGHQAPVAALALSADDATMATAGLDGVARLWRAEAQSVAEELTAHHAAINDLTFSSDGAHLVTSDDGGRVHLWAADGTWLAELSDRADAVTHVVIGPNSSSLVTTGAQRGLQLWAIDERPRPQLEHPVQLDSPVSAVVFAHDGRTFATFTKGHADVQIWSTDSGAVVSGLPHDQGVVALAATPAGPLLYATAAASGSVQLWSAVTGAPVALGAHAAKLTALVFSADGTRLVTASEDHSARLWDTESARLLVNFDDHPAPVTAAMISADGSRLVTATAGGVYLWDTRQRDRIATLEGQLGASPTLRLAADGNTLAAVFTDGRACWWHASTGEQVRCSPDEHVVESIAFDHDGKLLTTASIDGTLYTWSASTGEFVDIYRFSRSDPSVLVSSPTGRGVVLASGHTAVLLDGGVVSWRRRACELIAANADAPGSCGAIH